MDWMTDGTSDRDASLDETIDETFPASDAPANTIVIGIRVGPVGDARPHFEVRDNVGTQRLEIDVGGEIAFLRYERRGGAFVLVHTEVPPSLRGRGLAGALAKAGLEAARASGLRVVVLCPFVRAYLKKHPSPASTS